MIETKRLLLQPLTLADTDGQFDILRDPDVSRMVGVFSQPFTKNQAEAWCGAAEDFHTKGKGLLCAVFEKAGMNMIGYVGTACTDPRRDPGIWEVGYWLKKDVWGHGYTPEALYALMNETAEKFHLKGFYAELAQANVQSENVLKKTGFQLKDIFNKKTPDNPARPSYRYERTVAP